MKLVLKTGLNGIESIEKSKAYKYIKRFPKKSGKGWWYVYPKDLLKPFKVLETIFGIKNKNITHTYEKENIQKDYNVTKVSFASHILRYFVKKEFYDNKFSQPAVSNKYKKPQKSVVEQKAKKENAKDKPKTERKKSQWNLSLIRKIWSIYNPETAKNNEIAFKDNDYKQVKVGERINESDVITYEVKAKEKEETESKIQDVKEVDWYQAFSGSENRFYPNGTAGKPNIDVVNYDEKGKKKEYFQRGKSKTDLSGLFDGINDFVFHSEYCGEKSKQNFLKRFSELGFYPQKQYTDEKGETKYILMIRESSKSGNVELIPKKDYKIKEYSVITKDDNGSIIKYTTFNNIDDAHRELYKERQLLNNEKKDIFSDLDKQVLAVALKKELEMNPLMNDYYYYEKLREKYPELQAKGSIFGVMEELKNIDISKINMDEVIEHTKKLKEHGNKTSMLGNQNAKKFGIKPETYNFLVEKFEDFNGDVLTEFGAVNPSFLQYAVLPDSTVDKQKDKIDVYNDLQNGQKKSNKNNLSDLIVDIYNDYKGVQNGNSQNNIERTGISERDRNLRTERSEYSGTNGSETGNRDNRGELDISIDQSGIGLRESSVTSGGGNGRGRLGRRSLSEIRKEILTLLETKKDEEFTEEDKKLLAQYEGAGGLGEENSSASGTLYEYYTPQKVVDKVWQLVDKYLPQTNKTVIEPSAGIGKFANNRQENFTLFELEEVSSRIAKILHPNAKVVQGAFQENFMKNGMFTKNHKKFDVAIGNPPYGKYAGFYKGQGEGKEHTRYEEYFMDRTLDTLKDNGIMAFVVPSSFLRSGNSKIKEKLAKKGKLLEAWRLPNGTFGTTGVGTDIIIIRKEPGNVEDFNNNKYFEDNGTHIVGYESEKMGRFGNMEKYVSRPEGMSFDDAIDSIDINATPAILLDVKEETTITKTPEIKPIDSTLKFGDEIQTSKGKGKITGFTKKDGKITGYITQVNGEREVVKIVKSEEEKRQNRSRAMKGNKNAEGEHNYTPSIGKNMTVAEFNQKYGKDIDPKDIEIWKQTDYQGFINTNNLTESQLKHLKTSENFVKDGENYVSVVNYASGNILQKLEDLEEQYRDNEITKDDYEFKKSILEDVLPPTKNIGNFTLSPISEWVEKYETEDGQSLINLFFQWVYNGNGYWSPYNSPVNQYDFPPSIGWQDVVDYIRKIPVNSRKIKEDDKKTKDLIAIRIRNDRRATAEKLFNRFLQEGLSKDDQKALTERWNKQFNATVNPDYKKIPVFIDGMNTYKGTKKFDLTEQQIKGISFLTNKGSGLLAYDVGVGKTVTGIAATINQLQTGRSKRPLLCVPKAVYKKWINEIHQHFPDVKINELMNFNSKVLPKDWKAEEGTLSICTYEALERVTFKKETIDNELSQDLEYVNESKSDSDKTKRQLAQKKEKVSELTGAMTVSKEDLYFEDLGFDHITVDEIHNFKNIFASPRKINFNKDEQSKREANEFSSLGGSSSARGRKLFAITQYIQRHNDNRNVFGLSATPFTNSPMEIYSILSLFARKRLQELGIYSLEEFVKQFAQLKPEIAVKANGNVEEKLVMKNFNNLHALQNLITEYIDKVDGEEAGVIRPYKRTHTPELEASDIQKIIIEAESQYLLEQAELPKSKQDPGATLVSMNALRMATLSPALVDPERFAMYERMGYNAKWPTKKELVESSPKLKFVCDSVIEQYKKNKTNGQVIYMPRGVTDFPEVKNYLIKKGIPAEAIGMIGSTASTDKALDEREKLVKDFNSVDGKCKVLIGSGTIQEGVSLNGNSTTIYNTMLGWNPSETTQVEGRIWRQGNKQGVTHVVYPLIADSIDAMLYQKYDEKSSRINALWSYKGDNLNVEDINPEELKFGLIKDPEKRANLQIIQEKENAQNESRLFASQINNLETLKKVANEDLEENSDYQRNKKWIEQDEQDIEDGKKQIKDLKKRDKDEIANPESWRKITVGEKIAELEREIKGKQNDIKREKLVLKKLEDRKESAKLALERQGLTTDELIDNRVKELTIEFDKRKVLLENLVEKRAELIQKAKEEIAAQQKDLPSVKELVKMNVESIMSDLRPMNEVREEILNTRASMKKSLFVLRDGKLFVRMGV